MFREIRKEQELTSSYVFLYARHNIVGFYASFNAALKRAGIEDFTFHDLRHTFASHLVMRGASLKEVQELLGHKTMTMTLRYSHLAEENKKKAVGLLNGITSSMSQNVTKPHMVHVSSLKLQNKNSDYLSEYDFGPIKGGSPEALCEDFGLLVSVL